MSVSGSLQSYCTKDEMWCAIPFGKKQYIIIHDGEQVHLCNSSREAKKFIQIKNELCM